MVFQTPNASGVKYYESRLCQSIALITCDYSFYKFTKTERNIKKTINVTPTVYCKTFEDNSGALEMAKSPKIRPRTKQLNICFHHFREHVHMSTIQFFFIFYQFSINRYFYETTL